MNLIISVFSLLGFIFFLVYMSIPQKCKKCGGRMIDSGYSDWKQECSICGRVG